MFDINLNGSQAQQNVDLQRHCILIAASNPYALPTPVYRPKLQNLDQNENVEGQTESRLSDAESLAKSFPMVCLLVTVIFLTSSFFPSWIYLYLIFISVLCVFISHMSETASKT